jgi:transcriptional antiterminator RfaH
MQKEQQKWFLIRTKQHKEALVCNLLSSGPHRCYLPLLRSKQWNWGRLQESIVPLFPGYVFANFDWNTFSHSVRRTPGVVGIISSGGEPSEVPESIIDEIKYRAVNGIVELPPDAFLPGEQVTVVSGPLNGFHAIFERYLSGSERVSLILDLLGSASLRAVLPSRVISRNLNTGPMKLGRQSNPQKQLLT